MCLSVPGEVLEITENPLGMTMGRVSFGGIRREVCLAYVPEVEVGDYVLVHVGFALSKIHADDAKRTFDELSKVADVDLNSPHQELGQSEKS